MIIQPGSSYFYNDFEVVVQLRPTMTHNEQTINLNHDGNIHSEPRGAKKVVTYFSHGFVPGENDVICGRGSECYGHIGNVQFRQIVQSNVQQYNDANTKSEKSSIIKAILTLVRHRSPDGGFIKKDLQNNRFFEVGDSIAREKISLAFREAKGVKSTSFKMLKQRKLHTNFEACTTLKYENEIIDMFGAKSNGDSVIFNATQIEYPMGATFDGKIKGSLRQPSSTLTSHMKHDALFRHEESQSKDDFIYQCELQHNLDFQRSECCIDSNDLSWSSTDTPEQYNNHPCLASTQSQTQSEEFRSDSDLLDHLY